MSSGAFDTHLIPTGLGRLQVKTGGEGPPVLLWPSLLMSGEMWAGVAEQLLPSYRVVLVDPPGQGGSDLLKWRFALESSAECIPAVLDGLGIARAHFVGNSWGAMIGGTFAARHPDRAGAAILMNGTAATAGLRQKLDYVMLVHLVRVLGRVPPALYPRAVKGFLGPTAEREQPQLADYIRSVFAGLDARSISYGIESVVPRRPNQAPLFASIRTPVLVVAGEEDRTFPLAETRAMAEAIPGAEFVCMPGVAHLAGLEQPALVADLIRDFITRHPLQAVSV
jgi:3-oxoadipate enol-lactonase